MAGSVGVEDERVPVGDAESLKRQLRRSTEFLSPDPLEGGPEDFVVQVLVQQRQTREDKTHRAPLGRGSTQARHPP